jgi:hypothetical protein
MIRHPLFSIALIASCSLFSFNASAQDEVNEEDNGTGSLKGAEGFHIGFYIGGYFPNKNSTAVYNGYGYDANGNRNDFTNSYMFQKLEQERTYEPERIKSELGVINDDDWQFTEEDMPTNFKYNTAFLFGIALHYGLNKKQAVIANLNFAKLTAIGNFTIETRNSTNQQLQDWTNNQFAIIGKEQRMMIQLGYSQILGNNDKFNFFVEGGLCMNNSKFEKNFIQVNNLELDLTSFNYTTGSTFIYTENYTGWGFGGFAGLGFNISVNPKYTIQLLYSPSYETINLGPEPSAALQQAAGMRAYYNF